MVIIELPKGKDLYVLVPLSGGEEKGEESKGGASSSS
jgi:hypothetical protein